MNENAPFSTRILQTVTMIAISTLAEIFNDEILKARPASLAAQFIRIHRFVPNNHSIILVVVVLTSYSARVATHVAVETNVEMTVSVNYPASWYSNLVISWQEGGRMKRGGVGVRRGMVVLNDQ